MYAYKKGQFYTDKVKIVKLNQRIYEYADEENLIEKQELDGHNLEIYRLNPYEDIFTEFTNKGKFAVWSSVDGVNYRLYIEDGYYAKLKPLYGSKINNVWLKFWDDAEKVTSKYRNIIMPAALIIVILGFILNLSIKSQAISLGITFGFIVLYAAFIFIYKARVNKQLGILNRESLTEIKKFMGEKRFEKLLEDQRSYIDEFFHYEDEVYDNEDSQTDKEEVTVVDDLNENVLAEDEAGVPEALEVKEEAATQETETAINNNDNMNE